MTKVWLLIGGGATDFAVMGAYSSEPVAKAACDIYGSRNPGDSGYVEECDVDDPEDLDATLGGHEVRLYPSYRNSDGFGWHQWAEDIDPAAPPHCTEGPHFRYFTGYGKTAAEAELAAVELRRATLAGTVA